MSISNPYYAANGHPHGCCCSSCSQAGFDETCIDHLIGDHYETIKKVADAIDAGALPPLVPIQGVDNTGSESVVDDLIDIDSIMAIVFPPGTYLIDRDMTFTNPVQFVPGSILKITNGATVTFTGNVEAGPYQIVETRLDGGGFAVFQPDVAEWSYPEWWGAKPDTSTDQLWFIQAALAGHGKVKLQAQLYYISETIWLDKDNQQLVGTRNGYMVNAKGCTRLSMTHSGATFIVMGALVKPASEDLYAKNLHVENLVTERSLILNSNAGSCWGIYVGFCQDSHARDVYVQDCRSSWYFRGSVRFTGVNLYSDRDQLDIGPSDMYAGFVVDGGTGAGPAEPNKALRLENITTKATAAIAGVGTRLGLYVVDQFSDVHVKDVETVNVNWAIFITAQSAQPPDEASQVNRNNGLVIDNPVSIDCNTAILVHTLNKFCSIEINNPVHYPLLNTVAPGIQLSYVSGSATINGGQLNLYNSAGIGIQCLNSVNIRIEGTKIHECSNRALSIDTVKNSSFKYHTINNVKSTDISTHIFQGSVNNRFEQTMGGIAGKLIWGYYMGDATNSRNVFDVSGLSLAVLGTPDRKLFNINTGILYIGTFDDFNNMKVGNPN